MTQTKTKTCQNCKTKFTIEPEDFEFYKKIDVPEPTFCPDCRLQRRITIRNEINLYKRKCDFSGKKVFSQFPQEAPVKIYDYPIWNSDEWDAIDYGKDYDFDKSFFKQFGELIKEVPLPSRAATNLVNSDYCMNANNLKNCYLIFGSAHSEDCAYGQKLGYSKDSYDNYDIKKCELCYEGFMLANCYKAFFSSYCENCQEVLFSTNCVGCSNCFGCANLRHKKYHIFNKQYTKEEYFKKLKEFNLGSHKNILSLTGKAREFWLKFPNKFMHGRKNVNVTGEYINNSKDVLNSYIIDQGENLKYCQLLGYQPSRDCYDYFSWGQNAELVYESTGVGNGVNKVKFSYIFPDSRNIEYSTHCFHCNSLFACVGLRHKQYCIFNKQYTKQEYEKLVPKIKKHMDEMPYKDKKGRIYKYGEFFPIELSPFAYNETIANEYFPLTKEQVLAQGYRWYDKPKAEYKPTIKATDLPDHIKDVDKSILKEVIECQTGTVPDSCQGSGAFRLVPSELKFYQKMNIPLPRLCPDCRHQERIKQRNPMKLYKRQCMCAGERLDNKIYKNTIEHSHHKGKPCPNTFQTTYSPKRKEIVYCEQCYQREVE